MQQEIFDKQLSEITSKVLEEYLTKRFEGEELDSYCYCLYCDLEKEFNLILTHGKEEEPTPRFILIRQGKEKTRFTLNYKGTPICNIHLVRSRRVSTASGSKYTTLVVKGFEVGGLGGTLQDRIDEANAKNADKEAKEAKLTDIGLRLCHLIYALTGDVSEENLHRCFDFASAHANKLHQLFTQS